MSKFIQIVDSVVVSIFTCAQDAESWPGVIEVGEDDPRYVAFLDSQKPSTEAFALFKRDSLLQVAGIRIAPLQDAVDIGDSTDFEEAQLRAWKVYRIALNRIHDQPGYPGTIDWPVTPD
jgi:hypothetical protein